MFMWNSQLCFWYRSLTNAWVTWPISRHLTWLILQRICATSMSHSFCRRLDGAYRCPLTLRLCVILNKTEEPLCAPVAKVNLHEVKRGSQQTDMNAHTPIIFHCVLLQLHTWLMPQAWVWACWQKLGLRLKNRRKHKHDVALVFLFEIRISHSKPG